MPYVGIRPEHRAKITVSLRHARFDKIADPLWKAIHAGYSQEVARLLADLQILADNDRARMQP